MCCFSVADVFLEDPPPEKKKEEKKEEKVKKKYVLVSDQLNLQPIVSRLPFLHCNFLLPLILSTTPHIINHNDFYSPSGLISTRTPITVLFT